MERNNGMILLFNQPTSCCGPRSLSLFSTGKILRKKVTAKMRRPKNPRVIKTSERPRGREVACGLRAGPRRRRCSSQMPIKTTVQRMIIGTGFDLTGLLRRTRNGTTKLTMKTVQAKFFQGKMTVLVITKVVSSEMLPYQMTSNWA